MTISWTAEKNAKLFFGALEQLKDHKIKLDHKKLAEYMGPDCTARAVDHQTAKLKKQASSDNASAPATPATPASTPHKRRSARTPKTPTRAKNAKVGDDVDGDDDEALQRELEEELDDLDWSLKR